nr:fungal specific transcription factor [Colletotrichum truncatum]KAF6784141.1 fungal specific transcription factor [Colletotrichum truncatum]
MPSCDRCKSHGIECVYPQRVKRKITRTLTDRLSTTDDALSTILERLQRVEKHCTTLPNATQPLGTRDVPPVPAPDSIGHQHASVSQSTPSNVPSPCPSSAAGGAATSPWTSIATPSATPEIDTAAILKDAVDQVQRLRLQSISTAAITENVKIPSDLSKQWIENYFTHMHTEMFVSLINLKLIKLIPDLLELPHVHLDPAILVVYFGVLYHGCALGATFEGSADGIQYVRMLYLCCLRSLPLWQREATGTTTDFIAAVFMCRAAAECFDEELSWRMYTYACEYAQKLNLHNLDANPTTSTALVDQSTLDNDRKGFWEMIQMDFFYRLLFNKPPYITSNLNSWKVNLPWLSMNATPDMNAVPTMTFIIGSRFTFIVSRFFQALENTNSSDDDIRRKTEELCREVFELFEEWRIDEWYRKTMNTGSKSEAWMATDVVLMGYTYIIFMLRKLSILRSNSPQPVMSDSDVPDSPLAVDASRRLLSAVQFVLIKNPFPEAICVLFGMYRLYVAYACLMSSVIHSSDIRAHIEDVELLERLGEAMAISSRSERDFVPLIRAIQSLSIELKKRINEPGTNAATPMLGVGISM